MGRHIVCTFKNVIVIRFVLLDDMVDLSVFLLLARHSSSELDSALASFVGSLSSPCRFARQDQHSSLIIYFVLVFRRASSELID